MLTLMIVFSTVIPSFAAEEQTTSYDYLLSQGYPEDFLNKLTETSLESIVTAIADNVIDNMDYDTKYWCKKSSSPEDAEVAIYITTAEIKDNQNGNIIGKNVCIFWECLKKTSIIKEDYFKLMWEQDVFCYEPDSFYAEDYFKDNEADNWKVSDSYTVLASAKQNSIGHCSKMKNYKNNAGGFLTFNLLTTAPIEKLSDKDNYLGIEYTQSLSLLKTVIWITLPLLIIILIILVIVLKKKSLI